jgi:hypothetical protein
VILFENFRIYFSGSQKWKIDNHVRPQSIQPKRVGGDKEVYDTLTPLFQCMGTPNYMGDAGKGQHTKMANQILIARFQLDFKISVA